MGLRHIVGLSLVLVAVSLVGADVYGKLVCCRPIQIDFEQKPPRRIGQEEVYTLKMVWRNRDRHRSFEGSFVFISKMKGIKADHITFTYEGNKVTPQKSTNKLTFTLPRQTFPPRASSIINVEIVYNKAGTYQWEIGVAQYS